jgi:hypothetical protein
MEKILTMGKKIKPYTLGGRRGDFNHHFIFFSLKYCARKIIKILIIVQVQ